MHDIFTDRVHVEGYAISSVRPSVHLFVFYLVNSVTFDLDLLHVSESRPFVSQDY